MKGNGVGILQPLQALLHVVLLVAEIETGATHTINAGHTNLGSRRRCI